MNITAVLLAGGESRRMGKDKATILLRGKPLWQIQLKLLRKLEPEEILISARADPSWRPDDAQFVPDDPPSRGPLSGLAASMVKMRTTYVLALAIDLPFMSQNYLRYLCDQIEPGVGVLPKLDEVKKWRSSVGKACLHAVKPWRARWKPPRATPS